MCIGRNDINLPNNSILFTYLYKSQNLIDIFSLILFFNSSKRNRRLAFVMLSIVILRRNGQHKSMTITYGIILIRLPTDMTRADLSH